MILVPSDGMHRLGSVLLAVQPFRLGPRSELISSLMNRTEPSQNAKNPPPGCALLKPSVHVSYAWVYGLLSSIAVCATVQSELCIWSPPSGNRAPIHVPAMQNRSRSPIMNVLPVPSVISCSLTWLFAKKIPLP